MQWATTFHLDNGSAIYDAIADARKLGEELGTVFAQDVLARLRGDDDEPTKEDILVDIRIAIQQAHADEGRPVWEVLQEVAGNMILESVETALTSGVGVFEALAERYHVKKLVAVGETVDGKLPNGRPIVILYDPTERHMPSHYIALARALHDLVGYPVCMVNRAQIIEDMSEEWEKMLDLASWKRSVIVPRDSEDADQQI